MEAMDFDDKMMFAALMEEEAIVASATDNKHLMVLYCLMVMYAHADAKLRQGGSASGCHESKLR
jgi:hypothetical protein